MAENRYVFDNAVTAETGMRFSGLEVTYDPSTIGYLTGVGVADGWACWELGAGGGSIASWLAERVGPTGSVSDFAASLPQQLASLGLTDVGGEARVVFGRGGSPSARVMEAGLRQVGDRMIAAGLVDQPALDEAIAYLDTPTSIISMPTMVSAWGRRQ